MYGVIGFAMAVLLYFTLLADGGLDLIGLREIARDRGVASRIVPSVFAFRILVSAALAMLLAAGSLAFLPHPDGAVLAGFAVSLVAVGASTRWVHLGRERFGRPAAARVAGEALALALVVALVQAPANVMFVPLAHLLGLGLTMALLAYWLRGYGITLTLGIDWSALAPLLARSWRVLLAAALGLVVYNADLIFLRLFRDATTAGYYAAASLPVSLAINLGLAYRSSLLPTLTRLGPTANRQRELYHTALAQLFAAVFPAALAGWILADQAIAVVFGREFAPAAPALQVLIWAIPFAQLRDAPSAALIASAREDRLLQLNAVGTVLNLGLNVILIPRYGMLGAAWAKVLTEAVRTVLALVYARSAGFDLARLSRFWRATAAGLAMAAVLYGLRFSAFPVAIAAGAVAYLGALALLGGISFKRGEMPALTV